MRENKRIISTELQENMYQPMVMKRVIIISPPNNKPTSREKAIILAEI